MSDQETRRIVIQRFDAACHAESLRSASSISRTSIAASNRRAGRRDAIAGAYLAFLNAERAAPLTAASSWRTDAAAGFVCVVATMRGEAPDDPKPLALHRHLRKAGAPRAGVANMLMAERNVRRAAKERARCTGSADGNERARRFYARHGFASSACVDGSLSASATARRLRPRQRENFEPRPSTI